MARKWKQSHRCGECEKSNRATEEHKERTQVQQKSPVIRREFARAYDIAWLMFFGSGSQGVWSRLKSETTRPQIRHVFLHFCMVCYIMTGSFFTTRPLVRRSKNDFRYLVGDGSWLVLKGGPQFPDHLTRKNRWGNSWEEEIASACGCGLVECWICGVIGFKGCCRLELAFSLDVDVENDWKAADRYLYHDHIEVLKYVYI